MNEHGEFSAAFSPSDLYASTSHHALQLYDGARPTYVSNTESMPQRTHHILERDIGLLATEQRELSQLPAPADEAVTANVAAVRFVENTIGPVAKGGLYGTPESYSTTGLGYTTAMLGAVAIKPSGCAHGSRQAVAMQSALVHEQAHSTAIRTRRVILVDHLTGDEAGDTHITHYATTSVGMQKHKITYSHATNNLEYAQKNCFLEEAFAEETASRYRASLYTNNEKQLAVECEDGVERSMPIRYFSINENDPALLRYINSAFAAHAVELLSDYSGSNIYDLIKLSRDPAHETAAKRGIVQAIERIDKGLYKTLRDMPYPDTSDEFYRLYDSIVALTQHSAAATKPI